MKKILIDIEYLAQQVEKQNLIICVYLALLFSLLWLVATFTLPPIYLGETIYHELTS